jgi:hypothetical protein
MSLNYGASPSFCRNAAMGAVVLQSLSKFLFPGLRKIIFSSCIIVPNE